MKLVNIAKGNCIQMGGHTFKVIALDDAKGGALVLLDGVLATDMKYHDAEESAEWENCSLNRFLNDSFMEEFPKDERDCITEDGIFILSISEVCEYLGTDEAKLGDKWWWLRDSTDDESNAIAVRENGGLFMMPKNMCGGVRPTMWLNLDRTKYLLFAESGINVPTRFGMLIVRKASGTESGCPGIYVCLEQVDEAGVVHEQDIVLVEDTPDLPTEGNRSLRVLSWEDTFSDDYTRMCTLATEPM